MSHIWHNTIPNMMQNENIWNFHCSLTLNKWKLMWYLGSTQYMTHFSLFGMREKWPALNYVFDWTDTKQDIWNFHGSLTLNKGKLIWYSGSFWYTFVSNMTYFSFCFEWEKNGLFWTMLFICSDANQSSDILQHSQNRPTGDRWLKF